MNRNAAIALVVVAVVVVIGGLSSMYIVRQSQQALPVRLGAPLDPVKEPGLHFKIPFIDQINIYEARLLELDPPAEEIILGDQKRIRVDSFTRFRIEDPLRFYQALRTEEAARGRLREVVNSSLRQVLGQVMLPSVLSDERNAIMQQIQQRVAEEAETLGIALADVRIRRADLPEETSQSIYDRMRSEREREAREARAQGEERAQQIRSRAERERTVILAEARRQSQIMRGEGDAQANKIYAEAYNLDPEFFAFHRALQAYRVSMNEGGTSLVLSPTSEFFRFFGTLPPPQETQPAATAPDLTALGEEASAVAQPGPRRPDAEE